MVFVGPSKVEIVQGGELHVPKLGLDNVLLAALTA